MTGLYRSPDFRAMIAGDVADNATPILDALAERLQQSCQLALRVEDGFCIALQSTPSSACFVNMPLGLHYPAPRSEDAIRNATRTTEAPNPALPDVTDICAPVFRGGEIIALVIAPCIKTAGAPSPDIRRQAVHNAAEALARTFIVNTRVA